MQVQRRQVHKTVKDTESKSTVPNEGRKKEGKENKGQQEIEDKLEKLSLEDGNQMTLTNEEPSDGDEAPTTATQGHEPTKGHEPIEGQDTGTSTDVQQRTSNVEEDQTTAEAKGGEDEDQEELKAKVEAIQEQLLKSVERMQMESQETQEKLKKLTSYMKVLDTAPSEIHPEDEGVSPHPESNSNDADNSMLVGDVDPIAQAAILAGINERVNSQEEAGVIMEPIQVSETDPNDIVVVGEIMGPQINPIKSPPEEVTSAVTVPPDLQSKESITSAKTEPLQEDAPTEDLKKDLDALSSEVAAVPKTEPVESEPAPVEPAPVERAPIERVPVEPVAVAPLSHTPSKKPKRLLAASFMNN